MQQGMSGLSLALQGGGALGAFTWGVLDALLEAGVGVAAVSGASAGAVNAVVLANGLLEGGPDGARAGLERFWRRVSNAFPLSGVPASGAAVAALQASLYWLSPTQLNPLRIDPLRQILEDEIDFARLRANRSVCLLVSATRVRDGRARIFRTEELTVEAIMASTCLPLVNHSVEIDGELYWDGGYSSNPPLRELAWAGPNRDLLLIDLMAPAKSERPRRVREIERRVHEIALWASFHRELDALDDLIRLARTGRHAGEAAAFADLRVHRIGAGDALGAASFSAAMNVDWPALSDLKQSGYDAGRAWLLGDGAAVGPRRGAPTPARLPATKPPRRRLLSPSRRRAERPDAL